MKRSETVIRLIVALLALAILGYGGVYLYNIVSRGASSAAAERYSLTESTELTGLIVREETTLSGSRSYASVSARQGSRVAAGETLALAYDSRDSLQLAERIKGLEQEIALAQEALNGVTELQSSGASRGESARSAVRSLSADIARHSLSTLRGDSLRVRSLIFEDGVTITRQELTQLNLELGQLRAQSSGETDALLSPAGGLFSARLDGWENVSPAALTNLSVGSLRTLMNLRPGVDARSYGKLVTGTSWYLGALLPDSVAGGFFAGQSLTLDLSRYRAGECGAKVLSVSESVDGVRAVLFVCDRSLQETLELRTIRCPLILRRVSALRLPADALRQDGESSYVLLSEGQRRCNVTVLYRRDDWVLLSAPGLQEGTEVLLTS